jgi:hypothetical protein
MKGAALIAARKMRTHITDNQRQAHYQIADSLVASPKEIE